MKPLFIPLKREHFEAFASGTKRHEWRRHGPGWNAGTCWIGRPLVLSLGYSGPRLSGKVTSFDIRQATGAVVGLYGNVPCAVIGVRLD
jgi:hypothetical protein